MRRIGLLLVVSSVLWLVACGSSGNGGGGSSSITSVTAACSPSTILYGQTSQCSATVMGTGNFSSGVMWTASAGTISSSGLFTAPSGGVTSLQVTITATSTQDSSKAGTATVTVNPAQQTSNVQPIVVDSGPTPQSSPTVNEAFTSVTVCIPNTSSCQTIDHVLVDTGSSGLRLLSSAGGGALTLALPQANDSRGNPLYECEVFLDGYTWGSVSTADITVAGEKASSANVHVVIPASASPAPPGTCVSQSPPGGTGNEGNSLMAFGANGILGVGLFQQDCGLACTTANSTIPAVYYDCPSSGCNPTYVTLGQQVPNPVTMFASDNNGVLIQLPAVPNGGSANVNGSLIFGIGTQSNNGLGSATVYAVPDSGNNAGNFTTIFPPNGTSYPASFIDSGSNGLFFLNSSVPGVPASCSDQNSWYCPTTSPDNLTAQNQGTNMSSPVSVSFSIENADTLFSNNSGMNTAFSTLGGHNCLQGGSDCAFDWGLTFFFGRNMFTAIENMNTPGGTGPYFAY
ncbi:MAG TPA: DUF3443 family protein [Candidatus Limnocylindrales bacterium]|nr:DUF3443 family protein [Candidatus Limnocylindrales bacterium]